MKVQDNWYIELQINGQSVQKKEGLLGVLYFPVSQPKLKKRAQWMPLKSLTVRTEPIHVLAIIAGDCSISFISSGTGQSK